MTRFYAAEEKCKECGALSVPDLWKPCARCNGVGLEPYEFVQVGWKVREGFLIENYKPEVAKRQGWEPVGRMEKVDG